MADDENFPSSTDLEEEEEEDCYLSDQDDVLEETVLRGLEDGKEEDCHWSVSSVTSRSLSLLFSSLLFLRLLWLKNCDA